MRENRKEEGKDEGNRDSAMNEQRREMKGNDGRKNELCQSQELLITLYVCFMFSFLLNA
jgi:hypothetical protein